MIIQYLRINQNPYSLIDQWYINLISKLKSNRKNDKQIIEILLPLLSENDINRVINWIQYIMKLNFITKDIKNLIRLVLENKNLWSDWNNQIRDKLLKKIDKE